MTHLTRATLCAVVSALVACGGEGTAPLATPSSPLTQQPAQLQSLSSAVTLQTMITAGDSMPGSPLTFPPAPHGLATITDQGNTALFVAHDIGATPITSSSGGPDIRYARLARIAISPATGAINLAGLVEDGRSQWQNLRSGAAGDVLLPTGFLGTGFYSGEAAGNTPNDAVTLSVGISGLVQRLPLYGAIANAGMTVMPANVYPTQLSVIYQDGTPGSSELYLYTRDVAEGRAFVLRAAAALPGRAALHAALIAPGDSLDVQWVELFDRPDTLVAPGQRFGRLQQLVDSVGALPFVRLADLDLDRSALDPATSAPRSNRVPAIYLVDRGDPAITGHVAGSVNATCPGVCDPYGSLYRLDLNRNVVSGPAHLVRIAASTGPASGWASPGTVATSFLTIMIGEAPLHPAFAGTRAASIWQGSLAFGLPPAGFTRIAQTTQGTLLNGQAATCSVAAASCWDIGDIAYVEPFVASAKWIVSVRAHTLPFRAKGVDYPRESGQLLLMQTP